MIKKRIIGVITVKNSIVVQSIKYSNYLPIGSPEVSIENLERWQVDEIIIKNIDQSKNNLGPDLNLISRIASMGMTTPLAYAGGIRNCEDAVSVIRSGAERVVVDSLLIKNLKEAIRISEILGSQAVIGSLPLALKNRELLHFNYIDRTYDNINKKILEAFESGKISELMIIDHMNDGVENGFQEKLLDHFKNNSNLIVFGGISSNNQVKKLMKKDSVVGVAIGNFLNYREHSVNLFKSNLDSKLVRF